MDHLKLNANLSKSRTEKEELASKIKELSEKHKNIEKTMTQMTEQHKELEKLFSKYTESGSADQISEREQGEPLDLSKNGVNTSTNKNDYNFTLQKKVRSHKNNRFERTNDFFFLSLLQIIPWI